MSIREDHKPDTNGHKPGPIAIRAFARMVGVTDTTVHKFIKAGRMPDDARGVKKNGRACLIMPQALEAWVAHYGELPPPGSKGAEKGKTVPVPKSMQTVKGMAGVITSQIPNGEIQDRTTSDKQKAFFEAKIKELTYLEKAGTLLPAADVYGKLFDIGSEIRKSFQAIPIRVVDDILSAGSRTEASTILRKEIDQALQRVADLGKVEILKERK